VLTAWPSYGPSASRRFDSAYFFLNMWMSSVGVWTRMFTNTAYHVIYVFFLRVTPLLLAIYFEENMQIKQIIKNNKELIDFVFSYSA